VFPVRYELNVYIIFAKESVFKGLIIIITLHVHVELLPYGCHFTVYLMQSKIHFLHPRNGSNPCQQHISY
jgi:hypothetical protein